MSTRSSQVPQEGLGRRVEKMVQSALSELPIYNTVGNLVYPKMPLNALG